MRTLVPSWVLLGARGDMTVVATPWSDEKDKERYARRW
jgi:hypothetical protein